MVQFSSLYGGRLDRELGTDDSTVLFTNARRKAAVNEGVKEFARYTQCLNRELTVAVVSGTSEYDLNSTTVLADGDFVDFDIRPVEYTYTDPSSRTFILAGDDLPRRDVQWLDQYEPGWRLSTVASSVAQYPRYYYLRADGGHLYLGFTPQPSLASSATASIRVPYLAEAATLVADTDQPYTFAGLVRDDLNNIHQACVHYGAYLLEKLRRDDQASDRQLQFFMAFVQRFLQNRRIKGGRPIRQAQSYFGRHRGRLSDWDRKDPRT